MERRLEIALESIREAQQLFQRQNGSNITNTGGQLNATAEISAQPIVEGVPLVEAASLRTTPTPRSTVSNPSATLRLSRESILQRSTHPYNRQRAGTPIAISRTSMNSPNSNTTVPYPDREVPRSRRNTLRQQRNTEWTHRFICLASPEMSRTPSNVTKDFLLSKELGEKDITFESYAQSEHVKFQLELGFRKLAGTDFRLMRASAAGHGKSLIAVDDRLQVPPVSVLRRIRSIIYIIPETFLIPKSVIDAHLQQPTAETTTSDSTDSIESPHTSTLDTNSPFTIPSSNSDSTTQRTESEATIVQNRASIGCGSSTGSFANIDVGNRTDSIESVQPMSSHSGMSVEMRHLNESRVSSEFTISENSGSSLSSPVENTIVSLDHAIERDSSEFHSAVCWESLRTQIHTENPGVQPIQLYRDGFFNQALGMYMKNKNLNLLLKPDIRFHFEPALDLGGVTREYFCLLLKSLTYDKYDDRFCIFVGKEGHKVPCVDSSLLHYGIFKGVGKLMSHSLINTGIAGFGISKAVARYLLTESIDSQHDLGITVDDIMCPDLTKCIEILDEWTEETDLSDDQKTTIREQAAIAGFNAPLSYENKPWLKRALITYHVIDSRKAQLDDMKVGFRETGILHFTRGKENLLLDSAFPPIEALELSAETIFRHIKFEGDSIESIQDMFVQLLQELDQHETRNLLQFWTGMPVLPIEQLTVEVGDRSFSVSTCLQTIYVPRNIEPSVFLTEMKAYINLGSIGFGSV